MPALERAFFGRDCREVARALLGRDLVYHRDDDTLRGRIVEVEAYRDVGDGASHSRRGPTDRNRVMFGPPGYLYVYLIYGVHHCMNVVTEPEAVGAAVLIRAMEPRAGLQPMRENRGLGIADRNLTNGPGKCCQAFDVDLRLNGQDLLRGPVRIEAGAAVDDGMVEQGTRIGIRRSAELPWRYWIRGNPYVSR